MLTKRIIACLDVAKGRVVKGTNYVDLKDAGDPVELGKLYSDLGIDELMFLDITATLENRETRLDLVYRIAQKINIPFSVGGGIKTLEDIRKVLQAGADKVSLGSAAVKTPQLVKEAAGQFGSQCLVISLDAKKVGQNKWKLYIKGGREATGIDVIKFAQEIISLGAGELLVNSIDRDGARSGYDLELLRALNESIRVPIIASSGAGKLEHFLEAFKKGKVDAALAASLFHYGRLEISDLKKYLAKNNIAIRL